MTHHPLVRRARRPLIAAAGVVVAVSGLAACGSSGDTATDTTVDTSTADTGAPATETTVTEDTTAAPDTTAATDDTAAVAEGATLLTASVTGGEVETKSDRYQVALGSEVSILVETDAAEPVHLHGYDIEVDAAPGAPGEIEFTADVPGVFEVELEDSGTLLFEIEVS